MISVTVIIATYNRCLDLKRCLESLANQQTDGNFLFDVMVVDNNSKDDTRETVSSYEKRFPGKFHYLFEPQQGKCHALNLAIPQVKSDILAFTDDDAHMYSKWLLHLVQCFQQQHCDVVGGRVLPVYPPQTPAWLKNNINLFSGTFVVYDHGSNTKRYARPTYEFVGANFAFRRQVFEDCGLFRTDIGPGTGAYGEDTEFVSRAYSAGKVLYYCGEALVWHPVDPSRMNLSYIARWHMGLGRYRVIANKKEEVSSHLKYWFGVPRSLVREMIGTFFNLGLNIFNKTEFLKNWVKFFLDWGRAVQIKKIYVNQRNHSHI